jgi:hypothetical protein
VSTGTRRVHIIVTTACLQAVVVVCMAHAGPIWRPKVAAGIDSYLHTYYLADDDTTESVTELLVTAEVEGRSARRARHAWRTRVAVSAGSELYRELLDARYEWRPGGDPRLRLDVDWLGRQYRNRTEYALSSDNHEGTAEVRGYPWLGRTAQLDLRARGRYIEYRTPSALEQSYRERTGAAYLASRGIGEVNWRLGARAITRSYPDSSAIDRDVLAVEGDLDRGLGRRRLWLYHRSERRLAADEEVRPSAWSHWSDLRATWPAGPGEVVTNLSNEVWRYDWQDAVWFDAWRLDGELGYGWGDPLRAHWQALLTTERLDAGEASESYQQFGLRGTVETYAGPVTGLLALEYGHRWYRDAASADQADDDFSLGYSDFSYLEVWLMATWAWSRHLSLELVASYQPEQHTEQDDDTALGYGNVRLVWRP